MIKLIAFDLGWCLLRENDVILNHQEEILEKEFWNINLDEEYFSWACKTLSLSELEIKSIIWKFLPSLYSLREECIFENISEKYPDISFGIATNHISLVKECLETLWILDRCKIVLISWECWYEKPFKEFYNLLVEKAWFKSDEVLFIDDSEININWAKQSGLRTLHYVRWTNLTESVLNYLLSSLE